MHSLASILSYIKPICSFLYLPYAYDDVDDGLIGVRRRLYTMGWANADYYGELT